jgi:hypothetical protein
MRWLVIHPGPSWSVADVFTGWCEALRDLGEQVEVYNLDDRISFFDKCLFETGEEDERGYRQVRKALRTHEIIQMSAENIWSVAYRWWPDVILGISAFFTPPFMLDVLRSRGHKVVLLHTESPYQDEEQLERAAHADLNLVNDPSNLARYRDLGPAEYMPHAYRPKVHYPASGSARTWDLVFAGTGFPSRQEFFTGMDLDGLDVLLAGGWPGLPPDSPLIRHLADPELAGGSDVASMKCVDNAEVAGLYRDARCGINFYRREGADDWNGQGWAVGPREVEMAACGLFFLRDPRPESGELFPMLPEFTSPAHASELLRWWLDHGRERDAAGQAARAAIEGRTFTNNARRLLSLLDSPKG